MVTKNIKKKGEVINENIFTGRNIIVTHKKN